VYPPSDLVASLLELYFTNVHPTFPVLHRPSFERSVAEGLHLKDMQFGAALLAVLGVASRVGSLLVPNALIATLLLNSIQMIPVFSSTALRPFHPAGNSSLKYKLSVNCLNPHYIRFSFTVYAYAISMCDKNLTGEQLMTLFSLGTSAPQSSWGLYLVALPSWTPERL
jgi:hypothetical protein